jgi:hypothetical protein
MSNNPDLSTMPLFAANNTNLTTACRTEIETHRTYTTDEAEFLGLLALGPTIPERDILIQCCRNINTHLITANGTDCMRTADCPVKGCSAGDPAWDCVARMRNVWTVNGLFGCVSGQKKSSEGGRKEVGLKDWMMVVLIMAVAGVNGI